MESKDVTGTGYGYHRFEAGELKFKMGLSIRNDEYEWAQQEIEGNGQIVELDWRPLAEYGR